MVDYIAPTEAETDAGSPVTEALMKKVAFNPIAIAQAAAGAPRIWDEALNTTATDTGRNWVGARSARMQLAGLGTYALLGRETGSTVSPGGTLAGSQLWYSTVNFILGDTVGVGTWRLMGNLGTYDASLFLGIA